MAGKQHQQWVDIDSIVSSLLDENELSPHKRFRLWQITFRGMEQLGLDFFYRVLSYKLPVLANKTVIFPETYLNYTKIGVLNGKGEIITLKRNDKLTTYADLSADRIAKIEDNELLGDYSPCNGTFYNFWNGMSFVNLFGVPSGTPNIGSFTVDNENGIIVLNPDFNEDYLMVECVCTPKEGGNYKIPIQFKQALIAFVDWKSLPAKMKGTAVWERLKHDFYNERRNGRDRYKPLRLTEIYESNHEYTRLTIKN